MPQGVIQPEPLWPLAVYAAAIVVMVGGVIALAYVLGERRRKHLPIAYESGILPTGTARIRQTAKFYLIAMFFVIFDLEAVFIFAWVIAFRELGWAGYVEICIFIAVLVAALVYLWRQGALDWGPGKKRYKMLGEP